MSSRTAYRLKITGTLVAAAGLHVGSAGSGVDVDMVQAVDGEGRVHIPGTALTGALRTALGARSGRSLDWWGDAGTTGASRITICDAPVIPPATAQAKQSSQASTRGLAGSFEVRQRVSIDPRTRTAVPKHLFSQSVVPAGTRFAFEMAIEVPPGEDAERSKVAAIEQVAAITGLLAGGGLKVGHGATTGLGLVRLAEARQELMDLRTRQGLKAAVLGEPGPLELEAAAAAPWQLRVTIPWRPTGPLMSKQTVEGGVARAYPLTVSDVGPDGGPVVRLLLPGTEIKGIVRSHASYILRTLRQQKVVGDFQDWMSDPNLKEVLTAFGTPGPRTGSEAADGPDQLDEAEGSSWRSVGLASAKGVVDVDDVVTNAAIPRDIWQQILLPRDPSNDNMDAVIAALNAHGSVAGSGLSFDFATRNAIERWTGGVADGALFSSIEPYAASDDTWRPMVFTVDLWRLAALDGGRFGEVTAVVLALLLFVLRDIADGYVPFGYATSRGLGSVEVRRDQVTFDVGQAAKDEGADSIPALIAGAGDLDVLLKDSSLVGRLNAAWRDRFGLDEGTVR